MKKLIAFIILNFFILTNSCYAFSELYYCKNINSADLEPVIDSVLETHSYTVIKSNPYYATSEQNKDYAVIILQQSGDNIFYYYKSDYDSRVNKAILKELKKRKIAYEQSFVKSIISIYDDIADTLIKNSGEPIEYTFSDEPNRGLVAGGNSNPLQQHTYKGYIAQIASGTTFNVYLQNAINTATASEGDEVVAIVQDGISYNGTIVIPQGSIVYGKLTKARNATYGSISGKIAINFDRIVTPDNQEYFISTEKVEFSVANEGKAKESVKNAASSAAVGAIVGLLFGLLSNSSHAGRTAAIGAGVGAGSSLVYSVAEKGEDAEIPSFTEIELTLTWPLNVNVPQ